MSEWPPRFRLEWSGFFNLCIGHIQNGGRAGEEALDRLGMFLESRDLTVADLDRFWAKRCVTPPSAYSDLECRVCGANMLSKDVNQGWGVCRQHRQQAKDGGAK